MDTIKIGLLVTELIDRAERRGRGSEPKRQPVPISPESNEKTKNDLRGRK